MDKLKATLTRKLGPLPVWAWGALLVALIAVFLVWRRSHASGGTQALAGGGGTSPTDWTSVGPDPGLVPTLPVSQPSPSPSVYVPTTPIAPALTGSGPSFAPVQSSPARLTPVIPASNAHAIASGKQAGVVPQGPSPAAHPKIIGGRVQPSGISQMWAGARAVNTQATKLKATELSPLGAQANPHGRERT